MLSGLHRQDRRRRSSAGDGRQTRITRRAPSRTASSALAVRSWSPGRHGASLWLWARHLRIAPTCCSSAHRAGTCCSSSRCASRGAASRRAWVTFDKSDARSLLADERVDFAHGPTNRSIKNLLRNLLVAWRVVRDARPKVMLTTGAGVAVPFAWVARLHGAQGRLRREPGADRGAVAQLPADRAGRRPPLRAVAGARRAAARVALRRQRLRGGHMIFVTVGTNEARFDRLLRGGRRAPDRRGARRSSTATRRRS